MEHKTLMLKAVKGESAGEVTAEIATLGVKDHDGDVTLPGYFGTQPASIVLAHDWGNVQLGKGTITEQDDKAVFAGRFNMADDDPDARAVFSRLKFDVDNPPALIEWSYGYTILKGGSDTFTDHAEYGDGRYLKPLESGEPGVAVHEVSPVLVGAGIDTGTVSVKSAGRLLVDDVKTVLADLDTLTDRVETLYTRLDDRNHSLTDEKAAVLTGLVEGLRKAEAAVLTGLETEHSDGKATVLAEHVDSEAELILRRELLKFQRSLSDIRELEMI